MSNRETFRICGEEFSFSYDSQGDCIVYDADGAKLVVLKLEPPRAGYKAGWRGAVTVRGVRVPLALRGGTMTVNNGMALA